MTASEAIAHDAMRVANLCVKHWAGKDVLTIMRDFQSNPEVAAALEVWERVCGEVGRTKN